MKVVINVCFGGFSLSPVAVKRMAELQGREAYFFEEQYGAGEDMKLRRVPTKPEDIKGLFWSAFDIPDPSVLEADPEQWASMTIEGRRAHNELYEKHDLDQRPNDRSDKLLIQVVEELGTKAASGRMAELKIVEIPDDIAYDIEEYDGFEHIAEVHRTWG